MKKTIYALAMALPLILTSLSAEEEMREPYCSLADLPFDPQGWFGNAEQLSQIFNEKPITTIIEVGSWLGSSTRFLATYVEPKGKVYAVDTWRGSLTEAVHMQDPRLPYLYQLFLSNVKHAKLTSIIIPVRMESLEAARALNVKADLIYIDASHETAAVYQDILAWSRHLNEDAIMCGDDWMWPSVREAVVEAAKVLNKKIDSSENFWRFY
jgi:predicted O-methyltransferase YrrM